MLYAMLLRGDITGLHVCFMYYIGLKSMVKADGQPHAIGARRYDS